ncbi:MAG: response regulator transcription factor [Deltaproteobacteria bacterium]|nr:response regulator transcription factor [Deltaproteobacteria bacterium]
MAIRVLIAEDQRLLRQCFQEVLDLDSEIEVVAAAADGQEAVLLAEKHAPDIVLMDVSMPHLDGVAATNLIHERAPSAKVLILSLHDAPEQVGKAVKAGISGYVSKDVDLDELVRIIKAVHRGEPVHSPFLADQRLFETHDMSRYALTLREVQVLRLLVLGNNNAEIAEKLCVSEQTVKKELVGLFEKLGVKNRTQAAVKGFQLGLAPEAA